jgi:C-terminal processing protease CtpA/Prc
MQFWYCYLTITLHCSTTLQLLAAAVQDLDRGVILSTTSASTFGKGTAQQIQRVSTTTAKQSGAQLQTVQRPLLMRLTTARYFTPRCVSQCEIVFDMHFRS